MKFFARAILREPGKNFVNAISQELKQDKPDYVEALAEFREYAQTLQKLGVVTTICPADENYPDGNFVEDPYFILGNKLIIELNPGAPSRANEYKTLKPYLPKDLPLVVLPKEFTIDGGDILKDGKDIYIGLSKRTQPQAIEAFAKLVKEYGYHVHAVPVPEGLHLKSGMTRVTSKNYVVQKSFENIIHAMKKNHSDIKYFVVPEDEKHAANVLPVNGHILIPDHCPKTKEYVAKFYPQENIHEVSTQQARLVDGALSCSSLLMGAEALRRPRL